MAHVACGKPLPHPRGGSRRTLIEGGSARPTTNIRASSLAKQRAIERPSPVPPPVRKMGRSLSRPG
jgi:hypothetical protein